MSTILLQINGFINDNREFFQVFLAVFTFLAGGIIIIIIKKIVKKQENYQKHAEKMAKICRKEIPETPEHQQAPNPEIDEHEQNQENQEKEQQLSEMDILTCKIEKLHGKLATARLKAENKKIQEHMSREELDQETRMKNAQMESIMKLMMANQEKFGMNSEDVQEQMNLYKF